MTDTASTPTREPVPGIQTWDNPRNGFHVIRLHYTADPKKRSPAWKTEAMKGMSSRAWRREYEIDFAAPEGEPVIPEYDAHLHDADLVGDPNRRLLRFWDPGFVSPAVVFCQLNQWGQLLVLAELAPFNTPLTQLIPMVWATTMDLVGHKNCFDAGDPAAEADTATGNVCDVLARSGIFLRVNRPGTDVSYRNLRQRFISSVFVPGQGHLPKILINRTRCPNLRRALGGAFHRSSHPPYKVVGDHPFKDLVDAVRYGNDNLDFVNQEYQRQMTEMSSADWAWT